MNARRPTARQKAEMILHVRSGQITAAEAAKQLNISRKTYYKWERRGLEAMMEALCERNSGRPPGSTDEEKSQMRRQIHELEREQTHRQKQDELRERIKELAKKKET